MTKANGWPVIPLGDVVEQRKAFIQIDDDVTYKRCRVQLHAQGVVLRDEVSGAQIKTKAQQVCRKDEFLVAEIDAKMGGFGIVPAELDGALVSSHYFLFVTDNRRLEPVYLDYYSKTPLFRNQVIARGSTNYAAIRSSHVKGYTIPLPPIEEQRRIVAHLDRLTAKLSAVRTSIQRVDAGWRAMLQSRFAEITSTAKRYNMGAIAPLVRRKVEPRFGDEYPELGIRSFGKGTFHKPPLDFLNIGSKKLYRIQAGDLLFNNVFAWEGAIAVAQSEDDGRYGSHRFITCAPVAGKAIAEFLWFYFLTPEGLQRIGEASPGGAGRNRTLGLGKLAEIQVPLPPIDQQLKFASHLANVRKMQSSRGSSNIKLSALFPSILDVAFRGTV